MAQQLDASVAIPFADFQGAELGAGIGIIGLFLQPAFHRLTQTLRLVGS